MVRASIIRERRKTAPKKKVNLKVTRDMEATLRARREREKKPVIVPHRERGL